MAQGYIELLEWNASHAVVGLDRWFLCTGGLIDMRNECNLNVSLLLAPYFVSSAYLDIATQLSSSLLTCHWSLPVSMLLLTMLILLLRSLLTCSLCLFLSHMSTLFLPVSMFKDFLLSVIFYIHVWMVCCVFLSAYAPAGLGSLLNIYILTFL